MTSDIEPDFVSMTMEEMDEWIIAEDAKTPFTSFDLGTDQGRQGLLRKYYMIGDTSLFEAVSHIWASLNEPKAAYCTLIGMAARTGGQGKSGLVNALHKFLAEALDNINWIPSRSDYPSLDDWHRASIGTFTTEEEGLCVLLIRHSTVLNGGVNAEPPGPFSAVFIKGPWLLGE